MEHVVLPLYIIVTTASWWCNVNQGETHSWHIYDNIVNRSVGLNNSLAVSGTLLCKECFCEYILGFHKRLKTTWTQPAVQGLSQNNIQNKKRGPTHIPIESLGHDVGQSLPGYEIEVVTNHPRRFKVLENAFYMPFKMHEKRRLALLRLSALCQSVCTGHLGP
jgi:hypothetical protein